MPFGPKHPHQADRRCASRTEQVPPRLRPNSGEAQGRGVDTTLKRPSLRSLSRRYISATTRCASTFAAETLYPTLFGGSKNEIWGAFIVAFEIQRMPLLGQSKTV